MSPSAFIVPALLLLSSLGTGTSNASGPQDVETRPLKSIMFALSQDMGRISDGIWLEDFVMIEDGARAIASHPKVPPSQMNAISGSLGSGFEAFRRLDMLTHDTALQIVSEAEEHNMQRVLSRLGQLQQSCVACHAAYRSSVRKALFELQEGN